MNTSSEDLKHIRSMMERSTKFLSLSGLSGISAGIVALIGAYIASMILSGKISIVGNIAYDLVILAILTIVLAASFGLYFSLRKAKKSKAKFWMPVTKQILKDFSVPMLTGGIMCLLMMYHGRGLFVAPLMLVFYGLALISAGSHTYRDIKILGACEIVVGILAGIFIYNGLFFWSIGFGVLHIIYGIVMYYKYDKNNSKETQKI